MLTRELFDYRCGDIEKKRTVLDLSVNGWVHHMSPPIVISIRDRIIFDGWARVKALETHGLGLIDLAVECVDSMQLYHFTREGRIGYDEYAEQLIRASSIEDARKYLQIGDEGIAAWKTDPEILTARGLPGNLLASFNAG